MPTPFAIRFGPLALAWLAFALALGAPRRQNGVQGQPPAPAAGPERAIAAEEVGAAADDDAFEYQEGLVATYRSLPLAEKADAGAPHEIVRIDSKPAAAWRLSSPHPRLPPGPFEATWTGVLHVYELEPIRFGAFVGGQVEVFVGDRPVLAGEGHDLSTWIDAPAEWTPEFAGAHPLRVVFRSLPGVPARIQLWWEAASFSREPLPASRLGHLPAEAPPPVAREQSRERGRQAVAALGCASCHASAFPSVAPSPSGPSLRDLGRRVERDWLLRWLAVPRHADQGARMPNLFSPDRRGDLERLFLAAHLWGRTGGAENSRLASEAPPGDTRTGRETFVGAGCVACHLVPDMPLPAEPSLVAGRRALAGLRERFSAKDLASFLQDPHTRYPDGRMPKLKLGEGEATNVAAWLLSVDAVTSAADSTGDLAPATPQETATLQQDYGVSRESEIGPALLAAKGCARCHAGLEPPAPVDVRLSLAGFGERRGCLGNSGAAPHFSLAEPLLADMGAYLEVAAAETHDSPFAAGQRLLQGLKCDRCHQRDGGRPAPLEEIGRGLWTPFLYRLPFQRTPRLSGAASKFTASHLTAAIRDGVGGLRPEWYSYRMPAFGEPARDAAAALADADGDLLQGDSPPPNPGEAAAALGPTLAGFDGYACVSCHVWNGASLAPAVEPGAVGPDLTTVTSRIRRAWFDRWLENPPRVHPGTPMPAFFRKGQAAPLRNVLGGDAGQQRDALWNYLSLGKAAPSPKPKPPIDTPAPLAGQPPLISQIPLKIPGRELVESLCLLTAERDLVVFDLQRGTIFDCFRGGRILRQANLWRTLEVAGTPLVGVAPVEPAYVLRSPAGEAVPSAIAFDGYARRQGAVELRWRLHFAAGTVKLTESCEVRRSDGHGMLVRDLRFDNVPAGASIELRARVASPDEATVPDVASSASEGTVSHAIAGGVLTVRFQPAARGATVAGALRVELPAASVPEVAAVGPVVPTPPDDGLAGGQSERPGYRAIVYPRPKTAEGEDLIMPSALAADPLTGRMYVASLKMGQILSVEDPHDNGVDATYADFGRGLFQDVFALDHDGDSLFVLHRRNLSRLFDLDRDNAVDRVDRLAALPHGIGDAYDWAYGMVRQKDGSFILTYAPHANGRLAGSGSVLRLTPGANGASAEELAFGLRNALGWRSGPNGALFFTDNQGDWVAANKLCHVAPGSYYGYPNREQAEHAKKPLGKTTVWAPYDWAKSINGLAYDDTQGKFGPFAGQFFLAELMHGGAILRANVEQVNGVYQGACFKFWGRGLVGPLALAFDARGRLWVGGITQPGWMGQPDRGALFRIDFTGTMPFEIRSIHVLPRGFRLRFTKAVDAAAATALVSYRIEHFRYEYTGAYGSPELDRRRLPIESATLSVDGLSVDLTTAGLEKDRVYSIAAEGVRSTAGDAPLHATGVYTLNEVPAGE